MKLTVNREFAIRYLGVAALMLGLAGWFGYDGFIRYPATPAADLFAEAHQGAAAPDEATAVRFKETAVPRQKQFMVLAMIAALLIGGRVAKARRFDFSFDETGFTAGGERHEFAAVKDIDRSKWDKKGIISFSADGRRFKLDAWLHAGVEEFVKKL